MPVARVGLDADRNVSTAIVEAVAEAEGVSPIDVQPPLYYSVDVDALDDLFRSRNDSSGGKPRISFTYAGYEITIRDGETVVVRGSSNGAAGRFE